MQHHAVDERHELADTLRTLAPDAPTLCGDWSAGLLASHLVLRERSIVEVGGRLPVASLQRRAAAALAAHLRKVGYSGVIDQVDAGAPRWSPFALPPLREAVNLLEYVIHHEDLRRAGEGWAPRVLPIDRQQAIWSRLRLAAGVTLRSVPVGVELSWPSHGSIRSRRAKHGAPVVTVTGDAVELALVAFGRQRVAQVEYDGAPEDIAIVQGATIAI
jgi:uncharacterized protein (TIGR03085 family)